MDDYDVFLNHPGPDVIAGFVAHLEEALKALGLNPFLQKGDHSFIAIHKALEVARVHVAVVSRGYAESTNCLDELVTMLESGKQVIPVFYDVEPAELRLVDMGVFAAAFNKHRREAAERVQEWANALCKLADITAFAFRLSDYDGDEVQLKCEVVNAILHMTPTMEALITNSHMVGVEEHVRTCINKLEMRSDAPCVLGLVGMGGVGKSSLAKEIYNYFSGQKRFQAMSFLEIDRHSPSSMQVGQSLVSKLQGQLLWDLLQVPNHTQQRYKYWFNELSRQGPFLVVLDGLYDRSQFDEVILDKSIFSSGSCIIVTSQDRHLLKVINGKFNIYLYEVPPLGCDDAQKLFNLHAFGNEEALEKFKGLAMDVSKACGGLPLALKVVGSSLFDKRSDEDLEWVWPKAVDALKKDWSVMSVLRWSYDCLLDEEKVMFVDIACVFHGWKKEEALEIWQSCKKCSSHCGSVYLFLRHLIQKSLVVLECVEGIETLAMHGLLRDMGQGIGEVEGSHLWEDKAVKVVKGKAMKVVEDKYQSPSKAKLLNLATIGRHSIDSENFAKMPNLHYLILDGCNVHGNLGSIPKELRHLQWKSLPLTYNPPLQILSNLKSLDFSESTELAHTWIESEPGLEGYPNLLRLDLSNCTSLTVLPDSIGRLSRLQMLDLGSCEKLRKLPDSIGHLSALEELSLYACRSLTALPDSITSLSRLQRLYMQDCSSLSNLPATIGLITGLTLILCGKLQKLPDSIDYGGETGDIKDKVQKIGIYRNDLRVSGPSSSHEPPDLRSTKWASSKITSPSSSSSSKQTLNLEKRSGSLHPDNRETAISMLRNCLADLQTFNNTLGDSLQKCLEENQVLLNELVDANQREPKSQLTLHERRRLSLMLKDYRIAFTKVRENQKHRKDVPVDMDDVEFRVVPDGVPLFLYEALFSGGGCEESMISALYLCEIQVGECKKLLPVVRTFRQQCKNLVETLEPKAIIIFEGCHRALDALKKLEVNEGRVLSRSQSNSAHFCLESLCGLAQKLQLVVDLFRKCASENLPKTALELADLPPPPLMPKRWSEFSIAIRNCEWNMDLVEFAFCTFEKLLIGSPDIFEGVSFKWCEEKCRVVLQIQGKLGGQDKTPEKSMLDVRELEAEDLADLAKELQYLAKSSESTELVVLVEPIDLLTMESRYSDGPVNAEVHRLNVERQILKLSNNPANMAKFLSEKLCGPLPNARCLPRTFRVDPDSLKFRDYLDSGGAGMVGKYTWFGENVAVKNVRSPGLTRQKFEEETAVLATFQHPNVVRLIGCGFEDEKNTGMLVMELMDQDLRTVIDARIQKCPGSTPFATNVAIDIILQIAQAMWFLRDHEILHRDLKSKNILVNINEPLNPGGVLNAGSMQCRPDISNALLHTQENFVVKIIDFGLAKVPPQLSWLHTGMDGTAGWRAPEVYHIHDLDVTQEYKWPADVYSFAMTCYEILTGKLPFSDLAKDEIPEAVIAGKRPEGLDELDIPNLLKELVKKCWAKNPSERPTFEEIVKLLWECRVEAIVPVFKRLITGKSNLIRDKLVIDLTQDLLGVSSSGYVIRTSCSGGQHCVLKRIDSIDNNGIDLVRLKHPHVVQLIDHWIEERYLFLVMELMDGDLAKLMSRTKKARTSPFSLHVTVDLMLQIAKGMLYLHEMGVSHPHLKSENVLYKLTVHKTEAFRVGDMVIKLGGFGYSRPANINSRNRDVLCFGQTCLEILTGSERSGMHVSRLSIPETTPAILTDCIVSCLDTYTTFRDVVKALLQAKLYILQSCNDEMMYLSESIQTEIVPTKRESGLEEIFAVHQLHPQGGDVSSSVRATLIFFHGFHKVPEEWRRTWMTRDNKHVWPQKWLPEDLGAGKIRVLSVSFDANSNVSNKYNRHELGKNLLERVILSPRWQLGKTGEAIFLVGHSFGGVLIKYLVTEVRRFISERVQNNEDEEAMKCEKFLKSLAKIVFYSVPHAAPAALEFEGYISGCRKIVALQRSSFLQSLGEDTRFIADMNQLSTDFASAVSENVKVLAFLEGKPMSMKRVLVTEKSCEGLSSSCETWQKIDKDNHFEVCRPDSKSHIGYRILLEHLQEHMDAPCGLTSTINFEVKGPSFRAIVIALVAMGRFKRLVRNSEIGVALPLVDDIVGKRTPTDPTRENTGPLEEGNSHPPKRSASGDINPDGEAHGIDDVLQIAVSEPVQKRANCSQEFLGTSPKISGPLGSYHSGTAIRIVTYFLSDLITLNNIDLSDGNVLRRVEDNLAFLKELTEANQRKPNGPLTWQERNKLILMLKDYQSALMEALEDKDDEDVTEEDVEFIAEKDVCDGVPLYLYKANFSDGGWVESLSSALDRCEAQVREFKIMLPDVKVFQQQCKNLVETLEPTAENNFERCHKALDALKGLEVDGGAVSSGSRYDSARFCFESLIGLARKFQVVVDLFRNCASENLHKTALGLADLPSPPSMPKRWSEFSLAIRNCEWSMDLVEFAFYTLEKLLADDTHIFRDVSFKWCEEKSRMVLQNQSLLGRLNSRLERLGRQDSRLAKSSLDHSKKLERKDLTDLIEKLKQLGESARGGSSRWKLSGLLSTRADFDRANVASFLSVKLSGPIPHARYLPGTFVVDPAYLKFKEYLDSGGAGMVGKYTWFGQNVAVKSVRSPGLTRHKFEEEAAILATVQHPNVVRLIGCGFIEKNMTGMLVMELMDHDLRTVIEDRVQKLGPGSSPFPTLVAIDIILQIAQAMKHLRDHKVLHRDLKAKNVLVNICEPLNLGGKSNTSMMPPSDVPCFLPYMQASYVAKLADFGLAKCRPHSSWVRTRMARTTGWRAPEVFHVHDTEVTREYEWPADVYSFAMTCYEILTGKLPFANLPNQAIHENVKAGKRPEGLDELDIPDLLKKLVKKCWATQSSERPTFDEIVKSLWECRVKTIVPDFERRITSCRVPRSASNVIR